MQAITFALSVTKQLAPQTISLIFLRIPVFVFQLLSSIESMELLNAEHLREQVRVL